MADAPPPPCTVDFRNFIVFFLRNFQMGVIRRVGSVSISRRRVRSVSIISVFELHPASTAPPPFAECRIIISIVTLLLLRSVSEISSGLFEPRPWHIEIRHRVKQKTSTINLFGFETLKLQIRRLKLWKPTVYCR